jgi:hypothetical protein
MDEARRRLASMEAEFIRSLLAGGPYPAGADLRGMHATSELLRSRRVRHIAKAWPEVAELLGKTFRERAIELLAGDGPRQPAHAVQDGLTLALQLEAEGPIPDRLRLRLLTVQLRYRRQRGRLVRRPGPAVGWTYMRQSRRLVVALRIPGLALQTISVPIRLARRESG